MRIKITITILLAAILLISSYILVYSQEGGFIVKEKKGEWEKISDIEIRSKKTAGENTITLEYPKAILGSWQGNIDIDISGETGDNITVIYVVEIDEIGFKIEYYENYIPGSIGPIGEWRRNRLTIYLNNTIMFDKIEEANWPFDTRLNTRIYYTLYRSGDDTLKIVVQDYYGDIYKDKSIYWSNETYYSGNEVNLRIRISKYSKKPSQIISYLFFNDVIENEIYTEELNVKKLNVDMNALFYLSLGFLIAALAVNIFTKILTPKEEVKREEKVKTKKRRKKKR